MLRTDRFYKGAATAGEFVSKSGWIGLIGGALILLALILVFQDDSDPMEQQAAEQSAEPAGESVQLPGAPMGEESPSDSADGASQGSDATAEQPADAHAGSDPPTADTQAATDGQTDSGQSGSATDEGASPQAPPSFDVIRIDRTGDAVIAGRAAPGAQVTILDGEEVLGTVTADSRGEWVFLPTSPLDPGPHELRLRAQSEGMEPVFGGDAVVMIVPERGQDIAGRETDDPDAQEPLVLLIPNDDQPGAQVVQAPPADSEGGNTTNAAGEGQSGESTTAVGQTATAEPDGVRSSDGTLAVDTVDYDPQGNISIAGRGPQDSDIVAYLDNSALGAAPVDADGNWRINPDREVAPGVYRLRLDALRDGAVISRLEIPFSRAEPLTDLDSDAFIVVQPGNSLWRIARRTLGTGFNYTIIYDANSDQIRDPDLIYPGQVFEIPR